MNDIRNTKKLYLEWVDSCAIKGWNRIEGLDLTETKICSIGYLVYEDKNSVTITTSMSTNNSFMDPLIIPKCSIIKKKVLR